MRWLVDEGVPKAVVLWLRGRGDDVLHVASSEHRGKPDTQLWRLAADEQRFVLTRDLGLLFPSLTPLPPGVVLIRTPFRFRADPILEVVVAGLSVMDEQRLVGMITVVEPGSLRQRSFSDIDLLRKGSGGA